MKKLYELENKRFGKLIVKHRIPELSYNRSKIWLCLCDCGKEKLATSTDLVSGDVKSCGCLLSENGRKSYLSKSDRIIHKVYNQYKNSAKNRGIDFKLAIYNVSDLISNNCYYCGRNKDQIKSFSMGIDRVNNKIGYILGNCVPCCRDCNVAKGIRDTEEFLEWVELIYKIHRNDKIMV